MHGVANESALRRYVGPVFHYSPADGTLAVITSGQLRASEASSLNDLAEVKVGWREIKRWLANQPDTDALLHLRSTSKKMHRTARHQVFVLSGSTAGDDANQWRSYADNGRGYAFELDGAIPLGVVSLHDPPPGPRQFRYATATEVVNVVPWYHVLYGRGELEVALETLRAHTANQLVSIDAMDDDDAQEHHWDVLYEEVTDELSLIAHLFKTRGFVGEDEVRIVARFDWFQDHVGFHAGKYGIAGHLLLARSARVDEWTVIAPIDMERVRRGEVPHPLPIAGVRLGPLVRKRNRHTVRALLRANGLRAAHVTRSKVPMR